MCFALIEIKCFSLTIMKGNKKTISSICVNNGVLMIIWIRKFWMICFGLLVCVHNVTCLHVEGIIEINLT